MWHGDVEVRVIRPDGWRGLRDMRLAALQEAPYAFASTYQQEAGYGEADWRRRITGEGSFLAYVPWLGAAPVGMVCGFEAEPGTAELVSLWVRPHTRGHRIGQALVEAVVGWAQIKGLGRVHLWVNQTNDSARRLYERCGFTLTGSRQPLPSHPEMTEIAMARPV
jgi:GNAT superfamily N-acetyltransferase